MLSKLNLYIETFRFNILNQAMFEQLNVYIISFFFVIINYILKFN